MITAIVCDCVGVLTSKLQAPFAAFNERWNLPPNALGEAIAALTRKRGGVNPLFELETGRMSEVACMSLIEHELRTQHGLHVDMASFTDVYWGHLAPNAELISFLEPLRERYSMAMLTNNVREWEPHWRAMLPVDELFELVVDSSAVGMRKPDREIFELTLARLGKRPQECVFIDDLPHNCEAAAALGMRVVQFYDTDQAISQLGAALA